MDLISRRIRGSNEGFNLESIRLIARWCSRKLEECCRYFYSFQAATNKRLGFQRTSWKWLERRGGPLIDQEICICSWQTPFSTRVLFGGVFSLDSIDKESFVKFEGYLI